MLYIIFIYRSRRSVTIVYYYYNLICIDKILLLHVEYNYVIYIKPGKKYYIKYVNINIMDITIINIINTIIIYSIHTSKIVPIVTYNL